MNVATTKANRSLHILAAANKFSRYKQEDTRIPRDIHVSDNSVTQKLLEVYNNSSTHGNIEDYYDYFNRFGISKITSQDVTALSLLLSNQENEETNFKAGGYLSAVINFSTDRDFLLHVSCFSKPVNHLCDNNRKSVTIIGDVGKSLGFQMSGGKIIVEGNAGKNVGHGMIGGKIVVRGDVDDNVGYRMFGGRITIEGNAGGFVGEGMTDGVIRLLGSYETNYFYPGRISGGKIYHKRRCIFGQ